METHPRPEKLTNGRSSALVCKNCGADCDGNYCWRCGQVTSTHRITLKQILRDALTALVDLDDQGFLYTAIRLTRQPAQAIRDYLAGRRVAYFPPQKYLFWVGAVVTFLTGRFRVYTQEYETVVNRSWMNEFLSSFFQYADASGTLVNIVSIPVFALFSYLFFWRNGYNFAEHLVLNAYLTAQELLFFIALPGLALLFPEARNALLASYALGTLLYNGWVLYTLFRPATSGLLVRIFGVLLLSYAGQFGVNLLVFRLIEWWT